MTESQRRAATSRFADRDPEQAARIMRSVCSNFPTGVTVVTSSGEDGRPRAITVNSFTSVSLAPPLILVCIDRRSSSCASIADAGVFGVHFLTGDQWDEALAFAEAGGEKYERVEWSRGENDVPLLPRFAAALECRLVEEYAGGDHVIFVGEVTASHVGDADDAVLGFFRGRFVRVDQDLGLFREIRDLPADASGIGW